MCLQLRSTSAKQESACHCVCFVCHHCWSLSARIHGIITASFSRPKCWLHHHLFFYYYIVGKLNDSRCPHTLAHAFAHSCHSQGLSKPRVMLWKFMVKWDPPSHFKITVLPTCKCIWRIHIRKQAFLLYQGWFFKWGLFFSNTSSI